MDSTEEKIGGSNRGLNMLMFVPLEWGFVERSRGLKQGMRSLWATT